jgi:hypothetical protein
MSTNLCSHTVEDRANAVAVLVRQSVASWLEIAKHVRDAKTDLNSQDFENFVELTGLTSAICDKLCCVAQSQKLYSDDLSRHSSRLEGWTNLYELSKLKNPELDDFVTMLDNDQTVPVTREFIRSFRAGGTPKAARAKQSVVARIVLLNEEVCRLDLVEFEKLKEIIEQITRVIDSAAPAIAIQVVDNVIVEFETLLSSEELDETADTLDGEESLTLPSMQDVRIEEQPFF